MNTPVLIQVDGNQEVRREAFKNFLSLDFQVEYGEYCGETCLRVTQQGNVTPEQACKHIRDSSFSTIRCHIVTGNQQ